MSERCFACGKLITGKPRVVITEDGGQLPWVGPECFKHVAAAGNAGWAPTHKHGRGGPRLFLPPSSAGSKATVDAAFAAALAKGEG
jgi:hypothetical protein